MNQWVFVIAAYAVAIVATLALLVWACGSMRVAETESEKLRTRE